jgi:hypothetical protein
MMSARGTVRGLRRGSHGSAALEVLILAPVLFILIDIAIYAGCVATAHAIVHRAAENAMREETAVKSGAGVKQGGFVADSIAKSQGYACGYDFQDDNRPFSIPVGTPAQLVVTVKCTFMVPGVTLPGIPTTITVTETATSVLDTYRWRTP